MHYKPIDDKLNSAEMTCVDGGGKIAFKYDEN